LRREKKTVSDGESMKTKKGEDEKELHEKEKGDDV
jgi:hypothetical protein